MYQKIKKYRLGLILFVFLTCTMVFLIFRKIEESNCKKIGLRIDLICRNQEISKEQLIKIGYSFDENCSGYIKKSFITLRNKKKLDFLHY